MLQLCLKSEVTLKVFFKQTVAMAITKVCFRWAKCDHGLILKIVFYFPFLTILLGTGIQNKYFNYFMIKHLKGQIATRSNTRRSPILKE